MRIDKNLIAGQLSNKYPGWITGWMFFLRAEEEPLQVSLKLAGDFLEDCRGKVLRVTNPQPSDDRAENLGERDDSQMADFAEVQNGVAGYITAGQPLGRWNDEVAQKILQSQELMWEYRKVPESERKKGRRILQRHYREHVEKQDLVYQMRHPLIEWFSDENGWVRLEPKPSQVEVFDPSAAPFADRSPEEIFAAQKRRSDAMDAFLKGNVKAITGD